MSSSSVARPIRLNLFPGMEVSSSFHDGVIASYAPSLPEIGLGLGGVALAGLIVLFGLKLLRFLPVSLANSAIDPHHQNSQLTGPSASASRGNNIMAHSIHRCRPQVLRQNNGFNRSDSRPGQTGPGSADLQERP